MKVTKDKMENRQVFLTIEMEPAEVEESLGEAYRRLVKKTNIPGFRKGKAPRAVLERHLGRESLLQDALRYLLPGACERAVREQQIEPLAQPDIEVVQTDPLIFKATVPLLPAIELGDYHQLRFNSDPVEVTGDDINAVLERLRHQQATWEPVERAVDFGDLVVLDIESSVEGNPFINRKGTQYQVLQGLPAPVPGFAEQLSGMKRGEEKEFSLQFPLDYPGGKLAGKEASFKVLITEIKQENLPELSDELATEIDPELKTVDSLREQVSSQLRLRAEERARLDFEERVIEAAVALAEVDFPPLLVELEIDRLLRQQFQQWQAGGGNLEEYLKRVKKTTEELREEMRPLATKNVIRSLVLGKIIEAEKIEVDNSEIEAEVQEMLNGVGGNKDELQKSLGTSQARESIRQILVSRKAVQRLVEIARGSKTDDKTEKKEEKA